MKSHLLLPLMATAATLQAVHAFQCQLRPHSRSLDGMILQRHQHPHRFVDRPVAAQSDHLRRMPQHAIATSGIRMLPVDSLSAIEASSSTVSLQVNALMSQVDSCWQAFPYTAAAIVCGFKATAADMIAQSSEKQEQDEASPTADTATVKQAAAGTMNHDGDSSIGNRFHHAIFANANTDDIMMNIKNLLHKAEDGQAKAAEDKNMNTKNDDEDQFDARRNFAFLLYGSLYQGVAHEYIFNHLYPAWFGTGTELPIVCVKVAFNLLIQTTLLTLPIAYITKALICYDPQQDDGDRDGGSGISSSSSSTVPVPFSLLERIECKWWTDAWSKYMWDIQEQGLLTKCFLLWGPTQFLTFSVIPEHWRVTFIAFVSFFWLIALSSISANTGEEEGA